MSAPQPAPGQSVGHWVRAERIRVLHAGVKIAAINGPIGLMVLSALFWEVVDRQRIVVWAVISGITICPASLILLAYFRRRNQLPSDAQRWLRLIRWRLFLMSAAFGLSGVVLFAPGASTYQIHQPRSPWHCAAGLPYAWRALVHRSVGHRRGRGR